MIEKIKAEIERQSERNTKLFQDGAISVEALTARDSQLMIIRSFIESLEKNPCDGCVNDKGCVTCVDGNMKETNPQGLDEAASSFMPKSMGMMRLTNQPITEPGYSFFQMLKMFEAGAKWMAGQGETKEGVVAQGHFIQFADDTYIDLDPTMKLTPAFDLREGDVVDVSVRVRNAK